MLLAFIRYKRANYTNIRYTKRSIIRLHVIRGTQYTTIYWCWCGFSTDSQVLINLSSVKYETGPYMLEKRFSLTEITENTIPKMVKFSYSRGAEKKSKRWILRSPTFSRMKKITPARLILIHSQLVKHSQKSFLWWSVTFYFEMYWLVHKNRKEERRMETFMESLCLWPDTALKEED